MELRKSRWLAMQYSDAAANTRLNVVSPDLPFYSRIEPDRSAGESFIRENRCSLCLSLLRNTPRRRQYENAVSHYPHLRRTVTLCNFHILVFIFVSVEQKISPFGRHREMVIIYLPKKLDNCGWLYFVIWPRNVKGLSGMSGKWAIFLQVTFKFLFP